MIERIKNVGATGLSIICGVLIILAMIFLVRGGVDLIGKYQDLISSISGLTIGVIFLMLVLSVIPKLRGFAGMGIVYATYLWIFLLWLNCLGITYGLWGFIGVFIGIITAGIGIFVTAILASLFSGQWVGALILCGTILVMFTVRLLGIWIASKDPNIVSDTGY